MNIKVAAFTVSEKSSNTTAHDYSYKESLWLFHRYLIMQFTVKVFIEAPLARLICLSLRPGLCIKNLIEIIRLRSVS